MHPSSRQLIPVLALIAACAPATPPPAATPAPDLGKRVVAQAGVVSSAHPLASEAGVEMLRRGGNAVDAAVATAFAVSVGEPQMSGLGGGGSMLIWLQREGRAEYVDFYAASRPGSWHGVQADAAGRKDLRIVAIPGEVAGLLEAHERFGKLPREVVLAPAIRLAEEGVPVNQILAQMIQMDSAKLWRYPASREAFWPGGRPLQPGELLRQPELGATLRRVAADGRRGFYEGEVARSLVAALNEGGHPASMSDLSSFQPQWKRPLCAQYRGWTVLSAPPPQTGMQIIETLQLLEPYDMKALGLPTESPRAFDVLVSALRVGMADGRHVDDPNWEDVPGVGVTSEEFARARASLVGSGRAPEQIEPGDPSRFENATPSPECRRYEPYRSAATPTVAADFDGPRLASLPPAGGETTHLSVVDVEGNAVALTHTNSSTFGSGARVSGYFLNDSGIDFTRSEPMETTGRSPWRTRRSTISPTIVLRDGRAEMVVGAPGAGRIPPSIVQAMVYTLDYGMDPLEALRMPRIFPSATSPAIQLENGFQADVLAAARQMGYRPTALSFGYARLYMVVRRGDRWIGVADPRHNGEARGY